MYIRIGGQSGETEIKVTRISEGETIVIVGIGASYPIGVTGSARTDGNRSGSSEGIAKSWRDLRAKISKGAHNAPADGKYDLSKFGEAAADNPMAEVLTSWAKDNGLSQASFDDLVVQLQERAKDTMSGDIVDPGTELKKLGPNGQAMVNGMAEWGRGMVKKGIFSDDDWEEFKIANGTAAGLRMMMKLRETYEGRVPIQSMPMENAPSKEELYRMVGDPRYKTDDAYRQRVERLFAAVVQ